MIVPEKVLLLVQQMQKYKTTSNPEISQDTIWLWMWQMHILQLQLIGVVQHPSPQQAPFLDLSALTHEQQQELRGTESQEI